jgi:hypothetical protein
MGDDTHSRTFVILAPGDFHLVEQHIRSELCCTEGRCAFFTSSDFIRLRREAMYGVSCPQPPGRTGCVTIACSASGLYVYIKGRNTVVVGWNMPKLPAAELA